MATLVLAAAGAALGGTVGGTILGITGAVIGQAAGGMIGSFIDQKIMGDGSEPVEMGRLESLKVQSSGEGRVIPHTFGGMRVAGQVIWSPEFKENIATETHGGKGGPPEVTTKKYSYSVSLAIALGEGTISRIGRIWLDGNEISQSGLNYTVYPGTTTQLPDPLIAATLGLENTPAFRGTAYLVFENLNITEYGNRVPQFNFEVFRPAAPKHSHYDPVEKQIQGVCLIPGTGEYALATTPVHFEGDFAENKTAHMNSLRGQSDLELALNDLNADLPNNKAVSLVVSWFGDDLRCGECQIDPRVEQTTADGKPMPWTVTGVERSQARQISHVDDRPIFGGTPCDASVVESIAALKARDQSVMFYPFILMDIQADNSLIDPWTGESGQSVMPWRGRITTSLAPFVEGTPDLTDGARNEVDAFFGTVQPSDFSIDGTSVQYTGPEEWSYRRFILHYAYLCKAAGGVETFCIGSELRSLTQIRSDRTVFPTVDHLIILAREVKAILGENTKVGYAADWSEYFGYRPQDGSNDVVFHLDPLWADASIDFIGIDNYMPLSDWRDDQDHADIEYGSEYELDYLSANVAGGEGYDWYYATPADRLLQVRSPIEDTQYGQDWVFRYKDIRGWWSNLHHNRLNGVRAEFPTDWVAQSKPIYFTEYGCPAINKGTNQPNVFVDPKSSESNTPYFSTGVYDPLIQRRYLKATCDYWANPTNNPESAVYSGQMIDMRQCYAWAWDARPWPEFPGRMDLWSDGTNYPLGHWLSGRFAAQELSVVVAEICEMSGHISYDVSSLRGFVHGAALQANQTSRQLLQSLMMVYDFSSVENDGVLVFRHKNDADVHSISEQNLVVSDESGASVTQTRTASQDQPDRLKVNYWDLRNGYQTGIAEVGEGFATHTNGIDVDLPIVVANAYIKPIARQWLYDARGGQEAIEFVLPPSFASVKVSDVISLDEDVAGQKYRVQKVEEMGSRRVEAVRIRSEKTSRTNDFSLPNVQVGTSPLPIRSVLLDLPNVYETNLKNPLLVAATANPWPGRAALFASPTDDGYALLGIIEARSIIGQTYNDLSMANAGRWAHGADLHVKISNGVLQSRSEYDVYAGKNIFAIRSPDHSDWEIVQYKFANPQSDGSYKLSGFLRGQAGTDALTPEVWSAGSEVVFLNDNLTLLDIPESFVGVPLNYRIGPASVSVDDPSYSTQEFTYVGHHLRPYAPSHLTAKKMANGDIEIRWIRCTRIGGDSWTVWETPLSESMERYHIKILHEDSLIYETTTSDPKWIYTPALQSQTNFNDTYRFEVAQISESYGFGPYTGVSLDAQY